MYVLCIKCLGYARLLVFRLFRPFHDRFFDNDGASNNDNKIYGINERITKVMFYHSCYYIINVIKRRKNNRKRLSLIILFYSS